MLSGTLIFVGMWIGWWLLVSGVLSALDGVKWRPQAPVVWICRWCWRQAVVLKQRVHPSWRAPGTPHV